MAYLWGSDFEIKLNAANRMLTLELRCMPDFMDVHRVITLWVTAFGHCIKRLLMANS